MSSQDPSAPFSRVNFKAGGHYTAAQVKEIIRGLKEYAAEYPTNDEDLARRFAEEIKSWETLLECSKIIIPYKKDIIK